MCDEAKKKKLAAEEKNLTDRIKTLEKEVLYENREAHIMKRTVYMYVYICVYVYICIYIYIYACVCVYVRTYLCMYVYVFCVLFV